MPRSLYELIWKRTVASQMPNAEGLRMSSAIDVDDARFRASGKDHRLPGLPARLRRRVGRSGQGARRAGAHPADDRRKGRRSPCRARSRPWSHETQPPARYTEASLVKELDKRGIGRPSTWASIIKVLLDREYAFRKKGSALVPSFTAFAVVRMLRQALRRRDGLRLHRARWRTTSTASRRGDLDRVGYLKAFWTAATASPASSS